MSTLRTPVGPQPPNVYWRRRLVVGLGVLAVIIVIVLIIVRPGGGTPRPNPSSPAASESPNPSESPTATGREKPCDPAVVQIAPVTDSSSYAADATPQISMTITNTGPKACTFDVGTAAQEYIITSGADRIWSSRDCQTGGTADVRVLQPSVQQATTPFPWDRTRSSTGTCSGSRPAVTAGGASYHLQVKLGEVTSAETKQFILQ